MPIPKKIKGETEEEYAERIAKFLLNKKPIEENIKELVECESRVEKRYNK